MRIVLIGVSHWHTPFYLDPLLELPDVEVVGVSDPDPARAEPYAAQARCPVFTDAQDMCARLRPDFVFALGRHCDMAETARFLIAQKIPFAMEKPCALTSAEAHDIAARAAAAKLFAAVPFVIRYSPLRDAIREIAPGEALQYLSFKFVGGMVDRYRDQRVEWMLDRRTAGGGALLNLGIHFMDLCRWLLDGADLTVTGAAIGNRTAGLSIEDHAAVLLQGGGASCLVETGYLYPAPNSVFDLHYSIRSTRHHFAARDDATLEIVTDDRQHASRAMKLTNVHFYPVFVRDTLQRLRDGRPPIADLSDNAAAMDLVQAAYAIGTP
ncbi:MAG: Gfo/Idh/MocA family oxidoreductase [Rhodospirillales bacterium]|nr:Gfo/Idh/MocA family oxidoreductase [Rhodospirillales bacterium]MBN8907556.1 Gfo/Idh/MocA family oxidoreductase [Rhodospirillales bacterium]